MFATSILWPFSCWRCTIHLKRVICLIILFRSIISLNVKTAYGVWVRQFVHPSICSLLHSCSLCRHVMFILWGGALHDSAKNGCVADHLSRCTLRTLVGDGQFISNVKMAVVSCGMMKAKYLLSSSRQLMRQVII